jgi:hypothetical protein
MLYHAEQAERYAAHYGLDMVAKLEDILFKFHKMRDSVGDKFDLVFGEA